MRLSQVNKILLGSCVVVIPLSFYGGLAIKEHYLSNELEDGKVNQPHPHERAMRARIVQLEAERKELLKEGQSLDTKILDMKKRMASA